MGVCNVTRRPYDLPMTTLTAGHFLLLHDDLVAEMKQVELGLLPIPSGRLALNGGYAPSASAAVEAEVAVPAGDYAVEVLTVGADEGLRQWQVGIRVSERRAVRACYLTKPDGKVLCINGFSTEVALVDAAGIEALTRKADYDPMAEEWLDPYTPQGQVRMKGAGMMVSAPDGSPTAALAYAEDATLYAVIVAYDDQDELAWTGIEALTPWHPEDFEREPGLADTISMPSR